MNAQTTGESRPLFPHGFPPRLPTHLQYPLPTVPVVPEPKFQFDKLTVHCSAESHLFTLSGRPVAWILTGHHKGQQNKQTKHVRFVDLVYLRQTQRGANLETKDFDQLTDALAFVYTLFEQGGEA